MKHTFYQVDVFCTAAHSPFTGNPVAVVLDAQSLSTEQMQTFARWTNLSETTFVTYEAARPQEYTVRIFTPGGELPFAGHPSLGTAWAVATHYKLSDSHNTALTQHCGVGAVAIQINAAGASLKLPPATFTAISTAQQAQVALALNAEPIGPATIIDLGPRWLTVPLASGEALLAVTPDMAAIDLLSRKLSLTGLNVIGKYANSAAAGANLEVRSFAPTFGVNEDPVCGSGNGAGAYYLREHQQQTSDYEARQGRAIHRDGRITIEYKGNDIWLGGICINCIVGQLNSDGISS